MICLKSLPLFGSNSFTGTFTRTKLNLDVISSNVMSIRCLASKVTKPDKDKVGTVTLAYSIYEDVIDESKSKNPVIIMHGLLGSRNNWNSMAKALNKNIGRKIYTVDTRNHGESPHTEDFNYELLVSDALVFMKHHNLTQASIIGHSLGGRVGMMLALMYPSMMQSLVVVDISPVGSSPNMVSTKQLLKDLINLDLHPYFTLKEARKQAGNQLREKIKDEKLIAFILTNLVENEFNTNWRWKFNLKSLYNNFEKEVVNFPIVSGPYPRRTLFVAGADSDYMRRQDKQKIKQLFPAMELTFIEGAGHWVHADKPVEFLSIVSDFLNQDLA